MIMNIVKVGKSILYGKLVPQMLLDNKPTSVNAVLNSTNNNILITIPHFWNDASMNVCVNSN